MATVQHPQFEKTTRVVDDPDPWVEQGWVLLSDRDAEKLTAEQGWVPTSDADVTQEAAKGDDGKPSAATSKAKKSEASSPTAS